jgi:signal transduction histidine kinase
VPRTQTAILVFAVAAALAVAVSAVIAYEGLRTAFEREFRGRLAHVADIAASQLSAEDADDVRRMGAESGGFFALQAQLDIIASVTRFRNLAFVDTAGITMYDVMLDEPGLLVRSPYDSLAHDALVQALNGTPSIVTLKRAGGETRARFTPVQPGRQGPVIGVLVAESVPTWEAELAGLRKRLALTAGLSLAAIAVLAGFLMRTVARRATLERRLSRSENLAAMGRLTATLAHEIKNPLAIIRGSARRLGRMEPAAERLAESVVEEVDRLTRTVSRYLQFARAEELEEAGGGDLAAALASTLDLLEGEFRSRRCTLEREGLNVPAPVRLDPESLKQVVLNLVLNSLEAIPEGGLVRIVLAVRAEHAEFAISDDGPGMPPELLERLGEPFVTTKAQGTGLGVFMARRLVEGAGGALEIASEPGHGTTVTVRLPLSSS